jgi:hypothetical protein
MFDIATTTSLFLLITIILTASDDLLNFECFTSTFKSQEGWHRRGFEVKSESSHCYVIIFVQLGVGLTYGPTIARLRHARKDSNDPGV